MVLLPIQHFRDELECQVLSPNPQTQIWLRADISYVGVISRCLHTFGPLVLLFVVK